MNKKDYKKIRNYLPVEFQKIECKKIVSTSKQDIIKVKYYQTDKTFPKNFFRPISKYID